MKYSIMWLMSPENKPICVTVYYSINYKWFYFNKGKMIQSVFMTGETINKLPQYIDTPFYIL